MKTCYLYSKQTEYDFDEYKSMMTNLIIERYGLNSMKWKIDYDFDANLFLEMSV